ncbi:hypothetical protein HY345_01875 [Candidatus Microgenomates bacterium]|nr:hypothetical protein [Candidatus Microgenomates bacterium]
MKYPSVFLSILGVWIIVDILSLSLTPTLTFSLYLFTTIFSLLIFLIGFWRNK